MAVIDLAGVAFRYEDMQMRFDLHVGSGECLAIIGPSGAGKSTLLALIAGFERAEAGSIRIDGQDVTILPPAARPVTMLFQEHNLFAHLTVAANVGLGIHPGLRLAAVDRDKVELALAEVGLAGFAARRPGQISGGERQRVALARALVRNRPVLLLDEPFAALGPALRREMLDLVARLQAARQLTVLFVSHQPEDALYAATRTAFVHDGRILQVAETAALFDGAAIPELRAYLGETWGSPEELRRHRPQE
jgi:thiamine transport system ATP-binding protein